MADLSGIFLPTSLHTERLDQASAKKLESYLYQLTEQLRYVLGNLDGANMSAAYNATIVGHGEQLAELTTQQKREFANLRQQLLAQAEEITGGSQGKALQATERLTLGAGGAAGYFDLVAAPAGLCIQWRAS